MIKKRKMQNPTKMKTEIPTEILYFNENSRCLYLFDHIIAKISKRIVKRNFKNCSIKYLKVNEKAIN